MCGVFNLSYQLTAKTNTGILRCAQNDNFEVRMTTLKNDARKTLDAPMMPQIVAATLK